MNDTVVNFEPRAVRMPGDLTSLCEQHLKRLAFLNYASNTVSAYRRDLEQFVGYAAQRDTTLIQAVTKDLIEDFLRAMVEGEGNSARTAGRKLETVRGLFKFAAGKGMVPYQGHAAAQAEAPRWHNNPPVSPDIKALMHMLAGIPVNDPMCLRDRAMFRLMLDGALRVDGLCSMDLFNPSIPKQTMVWPNGRVSYRNKGGGMKETVVGETTLAWLQQWLDVRMRFVRAFGARDALFLTQQGNRMSRATIHHRIKYWGAKAGMPTLHCHLLRHSRARDIIETEGLATASFMLGHSAQSTTSDMYNNPGAELLRHRARRCKLPEVA